MKPDLSRLSSFGARALRWFVSALDAGEQAMMFNRLLLATMVFVAASVHAYGGDGPAQDFLRRGLPWLQAYLLLAAAFQAHIMWRRAPCATRRVATIGVDAAVISFGLFQGEAASAYLFPLYFWMILGNGVRLGARFMGAAVACSALGFAAVVWFTAFWRSNAALSAGLFLSLIVIPIYGGLLLRRLAEAHAEAERANHAKTLLLACVSHELRTPLTAIIGIGALLRKTDLDDRQREMVQTLSGAGGILLRHIEGLLTVASDEIGRPPQKPERVDLFALLVSLRALLAVEAEKKGVRLGLCIDADTPRHILAEPALLLDILQNLGGNAVKFTQAGAVAIHVGVGRRDKQTLELRVDVSDTGIGVDPMAQARIFDSFVQADPGISRRFGGNGLGLAIARRRLESRGGRIGVESEPGNGSRFWFELAVGRDAAGIEAEDGVPAPQAAPVQNAFVHNALVQEALADSAAGPQAGDPVCVASPEPDALALARRFAVAVLVRDCATASPAAARKLAASLKELVSAPAAEAEKASSPERRGEAARLKILLAEDNGVNRMVLDRILVQAGHATVVVADGEAAFNAMLNEVFDVILLDVNMPRIDGLEAARLYQFALPAQRRAPIIALTADAGAACRADCAAAGMAACLTKPLAPETLLAAIDQAQVQVQAARLENPGSGPLRPAAPEPEGGVETLDTASFAALAALGGEEFLRDLILQFLGEGTAIVERMTIAVEDGDLAAFQHEAHALNSSAGNIGASALARLCRSWRSAGPESFALYGDDFLDDLRREWSRVAMALSRMLSKGRASRGPESFSRRDGAAA